LRDTLQSALSCISPAVWVDRTGAIENGFSAICEVRSASGAGRLLLSMRHLYALISDASLRRGDRWQVRTTGYDYKLDDTDGHEIVAYHWHPTGRSSEQRPHLHIGVGAGTLLPELQTAHLSTGFVTPVPVLALLLESFGVRPRRADWAAVLEAADAALAPS
jgi:hypothetical protein